MTWAAIKDRLNIAVLATFGEAATFAHGATTTAIIAVIEKLNSPWLINGEMQISQHHYSAQINEDALTDEPVVGDTITTASGVVYTIDQSPIHDNGLYRLILRRA